MPTGPEVDAGNLAAPGPFRHRQRFSGTRGTDAADEREQASAFHCAYTRAVTRLPGPG